MHAGGIQPGPRIDRRAQEKLEPGTLTFDESGAGKGIMVYTGVDHGPSVCVMKLRSNLAEICLNSLRLLVAP